MRGQEPHGLSRAPADLAFVRCDIRDEAAVAELLAEVGMRWGRLDVLVNNAGVLRPGPFERVTRAGWAETMAVNAEAPFFLTQAAATRFATLRAVVSVASTSAFVAGREQSVYEASKAAVVMTTRSLAVALAPRGIRVNAVAPGLVDTPMTRRLFGTTDRFAARVREKVPLGRAARPDEIAEAIVFLASDDAAYMTGETLVVDGGWMLE